MDRYKRIYPPPEFAKYAYQIRDSSVYVVAIFFFLSAYGILRSYQGKREAYLDHFLSKRSLRLFIPLLPLIIVFQIYQWYIGEFNIVQTLLALLHGGTKNLCPNTWFVIAIFYFYLVFYICAILRLKTTHFLYVLLGAIFVLNFYAYYNQWGYHWYVSNLGLFSGAIVSIYEKKAISLLNNHAKRLTFITFIFLLFCSAVSIYIEPVRLLTCAILPVIVYLLWRQINFTNCLLTYCGKYSYEIYIAHGVMIVLLGNMINPWLFILLVVISTLVVSVLLNYFSAHILSKKYS